MIKQLLMLAFTVFAIAMAVPSSRAKMQQEVFKPIMDNLASSLKCDSI
jgi:hypothetical protein